MTKRQKLNEAIATVQGAKHRLDAVPKLLGDKTYIAIACDWGKALDALQELIWALEAQHEPAKRRKRS